MEASCCCRPYDDPGGKRQARECENGRRIAAIGSSLVEAKLGSSRRAMIPRSRSEMAAILGPADRFRIWFEIEA
jgi:hypothetical protein